MEKNDSREFPTLFASYKNPHRSPDGLMRIKKESLALSNFSFGMDLVPLITDVLILLCLWLFLYFVVGDQSRFRIIEVYICRHWLQIDFDKEPELASRRRILAPTDYCWQASDRGGLTWANSCSGFQGIPYKPLVAEALRYKNYLKGDPLWLFQFSQWGAETHHPKSLSGETHTWKEPQRKHVCSLVIRGLFLLEKHLFPRTEIYAWISTTPGWQDREPRRAFLTVNSAWAVKMEQWNLVRWPGQACRPGSGRLGRRMEVKSRLAGWDSPALGLLMTAGEYSQVQDVWHRFGVASLPRPFQTWNPLETIETSFEPGLWLPWA